jgi:hypothetical protein
MGTSSTIAKKNTDGSIRYIYCHWDGYIKGVGDVLFNNYKTEEKIDQLLNLGDLSFLGEDAVSDPLHWNYSKREEANQRACCSYRDRGDTAVDASTCDDVKEFARYMHTDFVYLWDGQWTVYQDGVWVPLSTLL